MPRKMVGVCIALTIVSGAGCSLPIPPGFRHETGPIERSVDFAGCRTFETCVQHGTVTIEGWDGSTVEMSAKVWAKAYSEAAAKRLAEETRVELKRTGDEVVVEYVPAVSMLSNNEHVGVDLVVRLPFEATARAESRFGDVSATNLAGRVEMKSTHGNIKLTKPQGPVDCRTRFGRIELTDAQADVKCRATHGNIVLKGPRGAVDGETTFGNITLSDPWGSLNCRATHGHIKVSIGPGSWSGQNIKLRTTFGNVRLDIHTDEAG